jgi:hypothetical protein
VYRIDHYGTNKDRMFSELGTAPRHRRVGNGPSSCVLLSHVFMMERMSRCVS